MQDLERVPGLPTASLEGLNAMNFSTGIIKPDKNVHVSYCISQMLQYSSLCSDMEMIN